MQESRMLCITVQPLRVCPKLSTSKSPLGKVIDAQDADKLSDPVVTGFHIEIQVGKTHNILSSKTNLVCPWGNKSSLGVKLKEIYPSNTEEALTMAKYSTV